MMNEPNRVIYTNKYFEKVDGGYHEHNYHERIDNLKITDEVSNFLDQLALSYPDRSEAIVVDAIQTEIRRNPSLKDRLINALKAGGIEAFKAIFNHPLVSVPVETIKGFLEAEAE
ncbi:MAG: hypothetical protein WCO29_01505 [Nostocales cyanobacterium ELA583]|jgi:regulator of sirC expression with transglutaminase-like and TPR domain